MSSAKVGFRKNVSWQNVALFTLLSITVIVSTYLWSGKLISWLKLKPEHKDMEVDVKVSMAGNPAHIGHMPMTALAVNQVNADLQERLLEIPCPIAKVTAIATASGQYTTPSGATKFLPSSAWLISKAKVFPNTIIDSPVPAKFAEMEILVVKQDCLDAAEDALRNDARSVAVLMLSSPIEPGGGMLEGNQGQEEDLCRRTAIFGFMWDQSHFLTENLFYNLVDVNGPHQKNPQYSSMTNNRMIHVPNVTVFRGEKNSGYQMLETPFEVGMLISPGLDRPEYERIGELPYYRRDEDKNQLNSLIMTQLKVAYDEGYDTVILGAFGCGAFWNPPELIAEAYRKIITDYFNGAFKKLVFAILDDIPQRHNPRGNLTPFKEIFS